MPDEYDTKEAETVSRWTDEMLTNVIPANKESAVNYWNAVNKQDRSQEVKDHFKRCMQREHSKEE